MNTPDLHALLREFHFLRPACLLVLVPLWSLVYWQSRPHHNQGNWSRLIDSELLAVLQLDRDTEKKSLSPWTTLAAAWTLAALALAGPSWKREISSGYRAPAAWVVVLDLSTSMKGTDLAPNRVTRARYAIDDVLGAARDARLGLVVFSDESYTVSPLTQDVGTVRALLPSLTPDIMPTRGDRLGPALDLAGQLLKTSGTRDQRVIVVTDGFDDSAEAFAAVERLESQGAQIDVLGVGGRGGAVADLNGASQAAVTAPSMDSDRLRRLATAGNGQYEDLSTLPALMSRLRRTSGSPTEPLATQSVQIERWQDAGFWLLPGLLFIVAVLARRGWL